MVAAQNPEALPDAQVVLSRVFGPEVASVASGVADQQGEGILAGCCERPGPSDPAASKGHWDCEVARLGFRRREVAVVSLLSWTFCSKRAKWDMVC